MECWESQAGHMVPIEGQGPQRSGLLEARARIRFRVRGVSKVGVRTALTRTRDSLRFIGTVGRALGLHPRSKPRLAMMASLGTLCRSPYRSFRSSAFSADHSMFFYDKCAAQASVGWLC